MVQETRSRAFNMPNILTYGRILAVPLIVAVLLHRGQAARLRLRAMGLARHLRRSLDHRLFRRLSGAHWHQTSNIGRMLDPIADKLLVASVLLLLAADGTIAGWTIWAAIIILCREILVSGLREYLAALKVSVPVTRIAKWKTTIQMVAIAFLLAGPAGDKILPHTTQIGIALLWVAALSRCTPDTTISAQG